LTTLAATEKKALLSMQREAITGLVLAGGRGSRMEGRDKGLQLFNGLPLALHALCRLKPQVGRVVISANRNLAAYSAFGVPVCQDAVTTGTEDFAGPLAGVLSGLALCQTPYLLTVPCDAPFFPRDLAGRLAAALIRENADCASAVATDGSVTTAHPVFCLMDASQARRSLPVFLQGGGRSVKGWLARQRTVEVIFDSENYKTGCFANANTLEELQTLEKVESLQKPPFSPPSTD